MITRRPDHRGSAWSSYSGDRRRARKGDVTSLDVSRRRAATERLSSDLLASLLVASGRGDTQAFEQLYDLTSSRIHALMVRRSPSPDQADRMTRVVYLGLWANAASYPSQAVHPLVWMILQAQHTLAEQGGAEAASGAELISCADLRGTGGMSRAQEEILTLVYLGGYSARQTGDLLRLPKSMVTDTARAGLRKLRSRVPAAS